MGPADLRSIMEGIPRQQSGDLIIGTDDYDDAAVYSISEDMAIVQTVDFFTPIVDDPFDFGAIAAANALSDIYAMGAKPILALNIACFPKALGVDILREVVRGGAWKVNEAGAVVAGGHTVEDDDLKFGLSVTGVIRKDRIISNTKGLPGDILYLTKAIGTGVISTALKSGQCPSEAQAAARESMLELNGRACAAMLEAGVMAATDVTGFGFIGHLFELAKGSGLTAEVRAGAVPLLPLAEKLSKEGFVPGGAARNRAFLESDLEVDEDIPDELLSLLFDPQTSGGLLIAVSAERAGILERALSENGCMVRKVGMLKDYDGKAIRVRMSER